MGILEPLNDVFEDGIPATPPDLQDLQIEDSRDKEDDLFVAVEKKDKNNEKISNTVFNFDRHIMPLMPSKMDISHFLGPTMKNVDTLGEFQMPHQQHLSDKKKKNLCSRCFDEVKKDLKKLATVIENFKNERDAVRAENESLKKEVKELKRILKEKENKEKSVVKLIIDNKNNELVDVSVHREDYLKIRNLSEIQSTKRENLDLTKSIGIKSFSVTIEDEPNLKDLSLKTNSKSKKTIAELRRDFFAEEFKSEQKSFTARNYLEIKPKTIQETERSRLIINVKPKKNINEIISKLQSKLGSSKLVPEPAPLSLFQRFEKTKILWKNDLKENRA